MGEKVCDQHGIKFSWMDKEQERMGNEVMPRLGEAVWQDRLEKLNQCREGMSSFPTREGLCRNGCFRRVNPGCTRSGKPFVTCCRGCILGFGHDTDCGTIDASKTGPGLCQKGCGRKIRPGKDRKGREWTTCCKGCALGLSHDDTCQQEAAVIMCERRCRRRAAPGFNTCCRLCAKGSGHSPGCVEDE